MITLPIRYTGPGLRGLVPDGAPAQGTLIDLFQGEDLVQSATTGANGEYLFTKLEPINYAVGVRTGDEIVACPALRNIEPSSMLSRIVGDFKLSR